VEPAKVDPDQVEVTVPITLTRAQWRGVNRTLQMGRIEIERRQRDSALEDRKANELAFNGSDHLLRQLDLIGMWASKPYDRD
jgi:hypothetical protein